MPEMSKEHLEAQERAFAAIGVSKADRQLVSDLSRHAAQRAIESINLIAKTSPDPRLVNVILLSGCMMVGEAAERMIERRMSAVMSRLPDDVRAVVQELLDADEAAEKVETKPKGQRDFDGNYR